MILTMTRIKPYAAIMACCIFSVPAVADLKPLNDNYLSEVTGKAFITIDNYKVMQEYAEFSHPEKNGITHETEFYRINVGANIETILSADELVLGKFDRYENGEPCPASGCDPSRRQERYDADVDISNFALGEYHRNDDGTIEAHPMKIENPFLEFAFENNPDGTREVIGVRLGFEKAGGILSGDMNSLTGFIDVNISGPEAVDLGNISPILGWLPPITVDVLGRAYLQYGEDHDEFDADTLAEDQQPVTETIDGVEYTYTPRTPDPDIPEGFDSGSADPIRADSIGILDEDTINASLFEIFGQRVAINIQPDGCRTATGTDTCQPLRKFESLELGKDSPDGMVRNFFLSTQARDMVWAKDPQGNLDPGQLQNNIYTARKNAHHSSDPNYNFTQTYLGGFVNIPSGGLVLTPHETVQGLYRRPTRYTDAGLGLFGQEIPQHPPH